MDDQKFEVEAEFAFVGRTFEEYARMFDLAPADLRRGPILDCPGGPGAFPAAAGALGAEVTAVDTEYGPPVDDLDRQCTAAVDRVIEQLREKRDLFVWEFYGDVDTRERFLRAAANRFLADYERTPERYVDAALPDLPFEDDAFALALSANLLFLYDDRLDRAFHVDALLELLRVASEVRAFPIHSLDRERSALVDPVVERVREAGHAVEVRSVPYEFQPGATEMLVASAGDRT